MTNVVADEVLGKFARQQNDWFRRVREGSLDPEEVGRAVQSIIDRGSSFKYDKRKDGWVLLEDAAEFTSFDISKMELIPFLKPGATSVNGEEMVRRATELKAGMGQHEAEYLLEHQNEIPAEFRKYYIPFTGTRWRSPDGHRLVAYLRFVGRQWYLRFTWLDYDWGSLDRLPRLRE